MALKKVDEFLRLLDVGAPLIHISDRDVPTLLAVVAGHKARGGNSGGTYFFVNGAGLFLYDLPLSGGAPTVSQVTIKLSMGNQPITDAETLLSLVIGVSPHAQILRPGSNVFLCLMERDSFDRSPPLVSMCKSLYVGADKLFKLAPPLGGKKKQGTSTQHSEAMQEYKPKSQVPTSSTIILLGETLEPPPQIASHCFVFGAMKTELPSWITSEKKDKKGNLIYPKQLWEHLGGLIQNECTMVAAAAHKGADDLAGKKRIDAMVQAATWIRSGIFRSNAVVKELSETIRMEDVGGYEVVKKFINRRKSIVEKWEKAKAKNVQMKGIFLVGIPGSGKTILLEAMGKEWGLPSYELNLNLALGRYVGESESRLQAGFDTLRKLAPCFCLIDEVDKVLAGVGEGQTAGSDVPLRIFGMLLRAMNESNDIIFGVSANRVKSLPGEFMRKGRFDKMFFMDVPGPTERAEIFAIHMKKRGEDALKLPKEDKEKIISEMEDFTGAEIESIVNEAVATSVIEDEELNTSMIMAQIRECKGIDYDKKEIVDLRNWAKKHAEFASITRQKS